MVLDVTAYGKAGHAARNEGDNAIYKVLEDIAWFRDHHFEKVSPLLGPVKMSVTQINAGTQHNVIPDRCTFVVDIRSNECYSNQELFAEIQKTHYLRGQSTFVPFKFFSCGRAAPDSATCRCHGTCTFRLPYPFRPGSDVIPFFENGTGKEQPFPYGR